MVVKTDGPYTGGLAAFAGKPAAGIYALVQAFLNNQATVEGAEAADIPLLVRSFSSANYDSKHG